MVYICLFVSCLCVFFFKQKTAYEMRISDWSSDVCSSDLIDPADVVALAASGFRSIVCNRPDGEEAGQPTAAAIAAAAEAHGLRFVHIPVMSGGIDEGDVATMARALADLPAPVLAYCRSGARSEQLAGKIGRAHVCTPVPNA